MHVRPRQTLLRLAVSAAVVAAVAAATLVATASARIAAGGGTVVVHTTVDYTDFDFQHTAISQNIIATQPGYDALISFGVDKLKGGGGKQYFVPYLADSWKATPKTIVFHLKKGPKCQDGTPITPDVVLKSFQRLLAVSTSLSQFLGGTQGNPSTGVPATGTGPYYVSADNKAGTFTFRATNPDNELLAAFAGPAGRVVCPSGLANPDQLQTGFYGSGPYKLVSARHQDRIVYQLNPDWTWGPNGTTAKAPGMPDTIVLRIVSNLTTAVNLALTGDIDILGSLTTADGQRLADSGNFQKVVLPPPASAFGQVFGAAPAALYFNVQHVPDVNLRKALIMVLDPTDYNKASGLPVGKTNPSPVLPNSDCWAGPQIAKLVPHGTIQQAQQFLTQHGYTVRDGKVYGKDGNQVKIDQLNFTLNTPGGEYVYSQWSKLGIDTTFDNIDLSQAARATRGDFDAVTSGGLPNIGRFSGAGFAQGGGNLSYYRDPVYEREIRLALGTSGQERCQHWTKVQQIIANQALMFSWQQYGGDVNDIYVRKGLTFQFWGSLSPIDGNWRGALYSFRVAKPFRPAGG
jgi:peptide/nickel transport system substrate-binding protein